MRNLLLCAVVGLATGCKHTVNADEMEAWIKARGEQLGLEVTKVTCPKIEATTGKRYRCQVELQRKKEYELELTVRGREGGKANFDSEWVHPEGSIGLIPSSKLETGVAPKIEDKVGKPVTIACSEPLLFLPADGNLRCDVTIGGEKGRVLMVFNAETELQRWELERP